MICEHHLLTWRHLKRRRKFLSKSPPHPPPAWQRAALIACLSAGLGLFSAGIAAATNVPAGTDLAGEPLPGDNLWSLQGDVKVGTGGVALPANLEITGGGTHRTITITGGNQFTTGGNTTLTLGNVTIDGTGSGNRAFDATAGSLTINVNNTAAFTNHTYTNTTLEAEGSVIYSNAGNINLGTNSATNTIDISGNSTTGPTGSVKSGSAIHSLTGNIAIGSSGSTITLSDNRTSGVGAVAHTPDSLISDGGGSGSITINGSSIKIQGNSADMHSGALYTGKENRNISIGNSSSTVLIGGTGTGEANTAAGSGGAIQAAWGAVTINGQDIKIQNNEATAWGSAATPNTSDASNYRGSGSGGAILSSKATTIGNSGSIVQITGNSAAGRGGAIVATNKGNTTTGIVGEGNVNIYGSSITISGNTAGKASSYSMGYLGGGAIYANQDVTIAGGAITLNNNAAAHGSGGAIEAEQHITISGRMTASGNTATGTVIPGTGEGDGGAFWAGGNVTLNATSGNILFEGNTAGSAGDAIYIHSSYLDTQTNAVVTFNAASGQTITFYDSIANNTNTIAHPAGARYLLPVNKIGAGAVVFDGNGTTMTSPIYGITTVSQGTFVVRNSAVYGINSAIDAARMAETSFTVASNATLSGGVMGTVAAGTFTLQSNANLNIRGSQPLGTGAAASDFSTFKIEGPTVVFGNNSRIYFRTNLNDGSSQLTDKLQFDGTTSVTGTASFSVTNHGGSGADTDTRDGIMLVEALNGANTTTSTAGADTFVLGNRVAAGAYEYRLYQGDLSGSTGNSQNWYLRSFYNPDAPPPPEPTPEPPPVDPPSPPSPPPPGPPSPPPPGPPSPPPPGPEPPQPGPEIPTYRPDILPPTVIPALASRLGIGMLGTWHERRDGEFAPNHDVAHKHEDGEPAANHARHTPEDEDDEYKTGKAVWSRIFGDMGKYGKGYSASAADNTNNFHKHGPSYDYRMAGVQVGIDLLRRENDSHTRDIAGLYVGYGQARANVYALMDFGYGDTAGRVEMEGYSLGGYYTRVGQSGWYLDAVLQGTRYQDIKTFANINEPQNHKTKGLGILASLEHGYPFRLDRDEDHPEEPGWVLEPQVQLLYQRLTFDNTDDAYSRITFNDTNALFGRLGARLSRDWTRDDGRKVNTWLRGSLWSDFSKQAKIDVSTLDGQYSNVFGVDMGGKWAQFDLGLTTELRKNLSLYVVGNYSTSISHTGHALGGRVGITYKW
ncbi:MAG: autotransporter outer membrane beta-barrel domain-containing protein [Syntrophaceae bacterium]|nr:autotransporter outer membrane beta-barrel domain-containing protein [Syntrophaceae bacterium]